MLWWSKVWLCLLFELVWNCTSSMAKCLFNPPLYCHIKERRLNAQGLGDFTAHGNLSNIRPASLLFTVMFTSTILHGLATFYSYFMTLHTLQRSKKLWLPCPTKPLQPAPTIADDVKLRLNKEVFWMDKIQMSCVKKGET